MGDDALKIEKKRLKAEVKKKRAESAAAATAPAAASPAQPAVQKTSFLSHPLVVKIAGGLVVGVILYLLFGRN